MVKPQVKVVRKVIHGQEVKVKVIPSRRRPGQGRGRPVKDENSAYVEPFFIPPKRNPFLPVPKSQYQYIDYTPLYLRLAKRASRRTNDETLTQCGKKLIIHT